MSRNKPHKPRVFCIGWHKTGTTTMGLALLELGYTVLGARLDMAPSLLKGDLEVALEEASKYDALQDVPWAALYKELDKKYPNSKFILTVRDTNSWLHSASTHFKDTQVDLHEWLYGNGVLAGNEEIYLRRFESHYAAVHDYFKDRPEDMITMDFKAGDSWEKLCSFLNEPIPKKAFPHANKGKHSYSLKDKVFHKLRNAVPKPLRKARVHFLEKMGMHKGRNRFNNFKEHQKWRKGKKT